MAPSIDVHGLNYKFQDGSEGLKDVELNLPSGSRTLLIGGLLPFHVAELIEIITLQAKKRLD